MNDFEIDNRLDVIIEELSILLFDRLFNPEKFSIDKEKRLENLKLEYLYLQNNVREKNIHT